MSCGRSISGERRAGDKFGSFTKDSMVVEIEFVLSGESEAVYCQIYLAKNCMPTEYYYILGR
jgi:uncharacterized membrane protein